MKILVLCTGNSCRSQMAHGFLESFDKSLKVFSAGTRPAAQVNPGAVRAMQEVGIEISGHKPENVEKYLDEEWDYVITVCGGANESCPAFTGKVKHRLHIGFEDPSEATGSEEFIRSEFRRVRDEIQEKFLDFYRTEIKGVTVLYFGSFNPFHIGHAAVAKFVAGLPWVEELCFVLSPKNPIKESNTLQDANERWKDLQRVVAKLNAENPLSKEMTVQDCGVQNGVQGSTPWRVTESEVADSAATITCREAKFTALDVEFHLDPPLYTYNTLEYLSNNFPRKRFALLMGGDNIDILHKWYRGEEIMAKYPVLVYPREGVDTKALCVEKGAIFIDAPQVDVSSTQIRNMQSAGEDVSKLRY